MNKLSQNIVDSRIPEVQAPLLQPDAFAHAQFNRQELNTNTPKVTSSSVTLDGNPEVGVVHHLGYFHHSNHGQSRDELIMLGQRTASILTQIGETNAAHCFFEGFSTNFDLKKFITDLQRSIDSAYQLNRLFPDKTINSPISEEQALLLAETSTPTLVNYFYPEVTLHGTEPDNKRVYMQSHLTKDSAEKDAIIVYYREVIALDHITTVLNEQPKNSRDAVLIYGANHRWEAEDIPTGLDTSSVPQIVKHEFESWSMFHRTKEFIDSQNQADQLSVLERFSKIDMYAWPHAQSDDVRLKMLEKLTMNVDFIENTEGVRGYLKSFCVDQSTESPIIKAIELAFQQNSGPFTDLIRRPGSEKSFEEIKGKFSGVFVTQELHPFTQLELINQADTLPSYCFHKIITSKGQLAALPKLQFLGKITEEEMNLLIMSAADSKVLDEIRRRAKEGIAPFANA